MMVVMKPMRALATLMVLLAACSDGSTVRGLGDAVTENRPLPATVTGIGLALDAAVSITVGATPSLSITAQPEILAEIVTEVDGGALEIRTRPGIRLETTERPTITVILPTVDSLAVSSSGTITATGAEGPRLAATMSGSGSITVAGTVTSASLVVSGSGSIDTRAMVVDAAEAVVSGSGTIRLTVTGSLDAVVSGSGSIIHQGGAVVTSVVTGSGSVSEG